MAKKLTTWTAYKRDPGECTVEIVGDGLRSVLLRTRDNEICPEHEWNYEEVAMLAAAAPGLLAELQEAETVIRWAAQESVGRVKAAIVGGWIHHADKIRAAIAKAVQP